MQPSAEEFFELICKGLGRTFLIIEKYGSTPYRDALKRACIEHLVVDGLWDSDRTQYVFELLERIGELDEYFRHIMDVLISDSDSIDYWHAFELATLAAPKLGKVAIEEVYALWEDDVEVPEDGYVPGGEKLIRMGGLDAFLRVFGRLAPHIAEVKDWYDPFCYLEALEETIGAGEAQDQLRKLSRRDASLNTFLKKIRAHGRQRKRRQTKRRQQKKYTYSELRTLIENDAAQTRRHYWRGKVRRAANSTMLRLAKDNLKETNPQRLAKLLGCFIERPFPLGADALLPLAQNADATVADAARGALGLFTDIRIRALAFDIAGDEDGTVDAVSLLARHYKDGDYEWLSKVEAGLRDGDNYHRFGINARDFIKMNPNRAAVPILLELYDRGICAICRGGIVDLLIELDAMPEWMAEECRFDSDEGTRESIAKYQEAQSGAVAK